MLAESATAAVNPLPGVIFIELVPDASGASVTLAGVANSVNEDGDPTVTETTAVAVKLPLVPVTVIEYTPTAAALLAAIASVLTPDPGAEMVDGVNPTVTPVGNALVVNATAPLNPVAIALVSVTGVLDPCCTATAARFAVSVIAGTIAKFTAPADVNPPPVAVIMSVAVPGTAAAATVMVNTLDPDPGVKKLDDASVAVTPAGAPVTTSVTALENPPATEIFAVDVALAP